MISHQQSRKKSLPHQQGAVAIIVAIGIVVLIGMLGLVLDLGHLYIAKSELQNAADAAALSGAKELDGSMNGVNNAKDMAIEAAGLNSYDLNATPVTIDSNHLQFSTSAYGPWLNFSDAQGNPSGKVFIKVDTGSQSFNTWFAQVLPGVSSIMQTFGLAVAGPYTLNITPMGVCAVDPAASPAITGKEYEFLRGVSYNIPNLNPLGVQPDQLWINPIDVYPGECQMSNASPARTYPYICAGSSGTIVTALPDRVYYDTGRQTTLEGPLNSRFGDPSSYSGGLACDPLTAPADINVREYRCTKNSNPERCGQTPTSNLPQDWMDPSTDTVPTNQSVTIRSKNAPNYPRKPLYYPTRADATFSDYGVLWSYSQEINYATGTPYSTSDWSTLYGGRANSYPTPSPYKDPSLKLDPSGIGANHAYEGRRVLNMLIMDCDPAKVIKVGACTSLPVLAVGKFFMQKKAELPDSFQVEFAGLINPSAVKPQIRLFQ